MLDSEDGVLTDTFVDGAASGRLCRGDLMGRGRHDGDIEDTVVSRGENGVIPMG